MPDLPQDRGRLPRFYQAEQERAVSGLWGVLTRGRRAGMMGAAVRRDTPPRGRTPAVG
jgi:hypothetical protein